MSDLHQLTIDYLSQTYEPIKITAPVSEWRKLSYTTPLFKAHTVNVEPSRDYLCFDSPAAIKLPKDDTSLPHPATFLTSVLVGYQSNHFRLDLTQPDDHLVTFETQGLIPNRWIRMLRDFAMNHATTSISTNTDTTPQQVRTRWTQLVTPVPTEVLKNLLRLCSQMMDDSVGPQVEVIRAPPYQYDNYKDFLDNERCHSRLEVKKCVDSRQWGTYDGSCQPSCLIFFDRCRQYTSFYSPDEPPYYTLAAAEGGICAYYYHQLPWSKLRPAIVDGGNGYHDTRGHTAYRARKDLPYEEIIVLIEALKKEGAIIKVKN